MFDQLANQNARRSREPYNPANQYPPAPEANPYVWYTGFMCKEQLSGIDFVKKFHKAQVCLETTLLIVFSLAAIESFTLVFFQESNPSKADWADSISSGLSIMAICSWFATSLYLNYRALQSARSPDARIREEGSYRCATKLGMASSIFVTLISILGAISAVFLSVLVSALWENPPEGNFAKHFFVGFIVVYGIGLLFLGVFPLCLAVMACKNLKALDETWNLTNFNDAYGNELRRHSYR